MRRASIDRIGITGNGFRAEVLSLGAYVADLTYEGKPLLLRNDGKQSATRAGMALLAPFANRVRNGEYSFNGAKYKLPVNSEGHAIHGFVKNKEWKVLEKGDEFVKMELNSKGEPGYPFELSFSVSYEASKRGFNVEMAAVNAGGTNAPITMGAHPYFVHPTPRSQWFINAGNVFRLEMVGNIPTGRMVPQRLSTYIGEYDDCYRVNEDQVRLIFPHDWEIAIKLNGFHFIQLFTPSWANAVAVEPMTGAPDAFNNGIGLTVLEPGKSLRASFTITPRPKGMEL
ncbi:aldose epimerase [Thermocladium modestius]|uniref:Aldose epimerase n=1 Tax=Thermocladium modestius TaxID=62609 RepID=A0A830GW46_9CREN|nr:aldose 1-epimerase [Thermocladium modestius]GGP21518.1 aldose epimerase [Thermocladium modestius]